MSYRLGVLVSHPIQYYAPWFRQLSKHIEIEIFYAHRQDGRGQSAAGFGVEFEWDIPLLEGYPYRWLTNVARRPSLRSFGGLDTPEIYSIIRKDRFDALLVFGWNRKCALQAVRACRRAGVPVLMRGDSQLRAKRSLAKAMIKYVPYRWFLPRLDAHLYVGQRNKAYLQHYGVPDERLFFVPHFVNDRFFASAAQEAKLSGKSAGLRKELGIPEEAFVFLFVGKLISKKRPADFVRACLKIFDLPQGSNVRAVIVGSGPLRDSLESLARPQAARFHFTGFRNQTQLPELYQMSDALVLPSDGEETWGLVVNEAAACGLPAVVSEEVGCAPDLIKEGQTGYTFPVADISMLTRRMVALKLLCEREPTSVKKALAEKVACYSMARATKGLEAALGAVTGR